MSNTIFDDFLNGFETRPYLNDYSNDSFDTEIPDLFGIKIIYPPAKPPPVELPLDSPISSTATIEADDESQCIDEDEERMRTDERFEEEESSTTLSSTWTGRYLFRTFVGKWEIKRNNM